MISKLKLVLLIITIILSSNFSVGIKKQLDWHPQLFNQQSDVFTLHRGYPVNTFLWIEKATPTIADINNDGREELLLPTYSGQIYAWDETGTKLSGYPIDTGGHIQGRLALGDLDKDGKLEIIAGVESTSNGVGAKIFIWNHDGTLFSGWPQNTACSRNDINCNVISVALSDLDNDSNLDVIAATTNRNVDVPNLSLSFPALYAWHSNGQLFTGNWPIADELDVGLGGAIAIGDINGDSKKDIVTGRDYNRLFAYDNHGNNIPGWPRYVWYPYDRNNWADEQIEFARSAVMLADLDGDGRLEYIVNGLRRYSGRAIYYNTDLLIYTSDGTRWRNWETPASGAGLLSQMTWRMLEAPAIGDINRDGNPDIVVTTQDGWVRAYTSEKQLLWSFNYAQGKLIYATEDVIGDVDGDGWNEVLFGTFDPNYGNVGPVGVWILDHNGLIKSGAPLWVDGSGINGAPALSDFDNDGKVEIAASTINGRVYVWDTPGSWNLGRFPWPMARHDLQRTGLYQESVPSFSQSKKDSNVSNAKSGQKVTFTIHLLRTGPSLADTVHLTDIIPTGLSYVTDSLDASIEGTDDSNAPTLEWSGSMANIDRVDVWYDVIVNPTSTARVITNKATITVGPVVQSTLYRTLIINGYSLFFPVIQRLFIFP